jgi:hypothetical protein
MIQGLSFIFRSDGMQKGGVGADPGVDLKIAVETPQAASPPLSVKI